MFTKWRLDEWNFAFSKTGTNKDLPPMSEKEILTAKKFLREKHYPKPEDCPGKECSQFRPACEMSVCKIAVGICGDF